MKKFEERGVDTLAIDFSGHGESKEKFEDTNISKGVQNILDTVEHLEKMGYLKIAIVGTSFGGTCSILAVRKILSDKKMKARVVTLALKCPAYFENGIFERSGLNLQEWKNKGIDNYGTAKLKYDFYVDSQKPENDHLKGAESITIPTLIVHGSKDRLVPLEHSRLLTERIKKAESRLIVIENADHGFTKKEHFTESIIKIYEFIIEKLK